MTIQNTCLLYINLYIIYDILNIKILYYKNIIK